MSVCTLGPHEYTMDAQLFVVDTKPSFLLFLLFRFCYILGLVYITRVLRVGYIAGGG